jgi:hypothetical protein
MICETCKAEGKLSRVYADGANTTCMGYSAFYDEVGRYHYHDPNVTSASYRCSGGHTWVKGITSPCPTCVGSEAIPV